MGNKTLAVDASIWLYQFVKAMRNEDASMMQNAHLQGFFRRLCKLLFMRIRPVIVFDGKAPALKRQTINSRRKTKKSGELEMRKLAERIYLNQLRTHELKAAASRAGGVNGSGSTQGDGDAGFDFSNPNRASPKCGAEATTGPDGGGGRGAGTGLDAAAQAEGDSDEMEEVDVGQEDQDRATLRDDDYEDRGGGEFGYYAQGQNADEGKGRKQRAGRQVEGGGGTGADQEEEMRREREREEAEKEEEVRRKFGERAAVRLPAGADYSDVKEQLLHLPPLTQYETLLQMKEDNKNTNRGVFAAVRDRPDDYSALQINNYLKMQAINSHIETVRQGLAGCAPITRHDCTCVCVCLCVCVCVCVCVYT